MANKKLEEWHLHKLKESLQDFPGGRIEPGERPDFLIHSENQVIGIEVTRFYAPPAEGLRPGQEVQSLKDRIVDEAHRNHRKLGGPALYVYVNFRPSLNLKMRDIRAIALELVEVMRKTALPQTIDAPFVTLPRKDLPACIADVRIYGSVDGTDQLWQADAGGWVRPVDAALVNDLVARKDKRMARIARQKCDKLWLLIVCDLFSRATPVRLTPEAMLSVQKGMFDRVFWLLPHTGAYYEAP